ncbi:response regulator transcription factor [Tengunoibacter tsumagoiensis]|uniref:DNA-binding response regulator n=1 Tax=Tengunoibacter tsumagoiensis TaxID=2014871 RepID=A0A401ZXQ3_9CHLR|nr:response regulator transcription factor [Tengunoibacter tsumagoiensis]GCE11613.1 DNA-binding response regulator [Tengunoibacter tsumagoiensis]
MGVKKQTILVADDDPQLLRLVTRSLELVKFHVLNAKDGEEALAMIEADPPDLVLLDVMMPHMDGFTTCQHVREFSQVPIIIITARGRDDDKVKGLNLGADDYLTKPFSIEELEARVRAVLRRSQWVASGQPQKDQKKKVIGDICIDFEQCVVTIRNEEISLTATEYRILAYLMQNAGRVLTQDLLLEHIWGQEYTGESHMLQVSVNRLRRKIEPDPAHPTYIHTKIGIGYQFSTTPKLA